MLTNCLIGVEGNTPGMGVAVPVELFFIIVIRSAKNEYFFILLPHLNLKNKPG